MKKLIIVIFFGLTVVPAFAQKHVIDTPVYHNWPGGVGAGGMSNDGKYLNYFANGKALIQSVAGDWKQELSKVVQVFFSGNSRLAIYQQRADSLSLQTLGSNEIMYISHVDNFKVIQNGNWLLYQTTGPQKELVLKNLSTGNQRSFAKVNAYQFNPGESSMLLQQQNADSTLTINLLDFSTGGYKPVWTGSNAGNFIFSNDGKALAFSETDKNGGQTIWAWQAGDPKAIKLFADSNFDSPEKKINGLIGFSGADDKLFFTVAKTITAAKPNPNLASVDVYSYKDPALQSEQLQALQHNPAYYNCVIHIPDGQVIQLEQKGEYLFGGLEKTDRKDFVLVRKTKDSRDPAGRNDINLISSTDGRSKCLRSAVLDAATFNYWLSPDNQYVIYYDAVQRNYFSYTIATGTTSNITKGLKVDWLKGIDEPDSIYAVNSSFHWFKNDAAVLIQSQNDLIQVDPSGKTAAVDLTRGYGQSHHIRFSLANVNGNSDEALDPNQPLVLEAFNQRTKDIAFCKVMPGLPNQIRGLTFIPYQADHLQKAGEADVYIMNLSNAENSPNLFLTTDFKNFKSLTDVHPEKNYNWLTAKLVSWKTPDGKTTQGILYKPENFDLKKKYPVIFFYYERKSDGLHQFLQPDYNDVGEINIPTFVSNGYLVFLPDIHYKIGYPGRSACDAVTSAARYLGQFPWVDTQHMGLVGHSFGGFETNYIITHSHLFAAAVSASGQTDFISGYDLRNGGNVGGRQLIYEMGQSRIGATLWQRPDLYVENSPVLRADKVTTPVLMMANKQDFVVPYEFGFELFMALRRLNKKVWLLQYDHGGHDTDDQGSSEEGAADVKDFTIRSRQFFDYYLKDKLPPKWMVEGVPASMKQIESGLAADKSGKQP